MRRIAESNDWGYTPIITEHNLFPKKSCPRISYLRNDRLGAILGDCLETTFGPRRIAVRRSLFGRAISTKTFNTRDFIGVAVELRRKSAGQLMVEADTERSEAFHAVLYLMHEERAKDLLLYEAFEDSEIIALWQFWSKRLHLPMLSVRPDGEIVEPSKFMGMVEHTTSFPRAPMIYLKGRKPIFLAVRDMGVHQNVRRLPGREIMART